MDLKQEKLAIEGELTCIESDLACLYNKIGKLRQIAASNRRRLNEINRMLAPVTILPPYDPTVRKRTQHGLQITPSKLQAALAALPPELREQLARMA